MEALENEIKQQNTSTRGHKREIGNKRKISNFQTRKFKITSYYSRHYSNSAVTIQIRGTIQNIKYYSNSEYEQENPTHKVDEPLQEVSTLCTFLNNNLGALSNSASRASLSRYYLQQYSGNIYWLSMRLTLNLRKLTGHEHSPASGSGTQVLHYSTIATCVGGA